jgi:hypothetical protein
MILNRKGQLLPETVHDHGPRPECLNVKFRHNGTKSGWHRAACRLRTLSCTWLPWPGRANRPAGTHHAPFGQKNLGIPAVQEGRILGRDISPEHRVEIH